MLKTSSIPAGHLPTLGSPTIGIAAAVWELLVLVLVLVLQQPPFYSLNVALVTVREYGGCHLDGSSGAGHIDTW